MPMRQTPGLGLNAFWDLGADGWNTGMDTNLRLLSAVVGARVQSRTSPLPGSPAVGSIYIVPLGAGTNENRIAVWDGPDGARQWFYLNPQPGWHFYVIDEGINVQWTGSGWVEFAAGGGGGGGGVQGSQLLVKLAQVAPQTIDNTTDTLVFGDIISDDEELFVEADSTIRIPENQEGRTAIFVANTRHTTDGSGLVETTLERSEDGGSTWVAIASSADASDYFGTTTLTALVSFIGGERYRLRHTTTENKTTTGDGQTTLTLTTVGAGQIGRIVRTTSTRVVENPTFDTGDFTGWNAQTEDGTLRVYIPPDRETDHALHPDGYAYVGLSGSIGGPWFIETVVDIPTDPQVVTVYWDQHTRLVDDMMRLEIDFLDSSDVVLGVYSGTTRLNSQAALWETFADSAYNVPSGATKARVRLAAVEIAGSQQINVTNIRVQATTLGVSGMIPGSVYAYLPSLAGQANKVLRVNSTGDNVEWGAPPMRVRAGAVDEPEANDLRFVGSAFNASKSGDTVEIEFTGGVALHGAAGQVAQSISKLTILGGGATVSSPLAGEIEITIPGPGEAVPPATTIEEVEGINAVRSSMTADQNGMPLIWDSAANAFIPAPVGFGKIPYGGGTDLLWSGDLAGVRDVLLTDADHDLYQYDELHVILRNANDHAEVSVSTDGGSTWASTLEAYLGGGAIYEGINSTDHFMLGAWNSDTDMQIGYGVMRFFSNAGVPTTWEMFGGAPGSSGERQGRGFTASAARHNAIMVRRDSPGNFTGGQLFVVGVKKAQQPIDVSGRVENGAALAADQELMVHETLGLRFDPGQPVGRVRVDPATATDTTFSFQSDDGTELFTVLVAAGEVAADVIVPDVIVVNDALRVVAPSTPDANVQSVYVALRGEAAR